MKDLIIASRIKIAVDIFPAAKSVYVWDEILSETKKKKNCLLFSLLKSILKLSVGVYRSQGVCLHVYYTREMQIGV